MIKITNKSDEKITLTTDMRISLVNAIRRSINEIPTLAIDSLEISKNDSALYDEIVAHRAGLIPLKNEDLRLPDECVCKGKGCGKCMIKLKLKAKGPGSVYSDDLSPKGSVIYNMPISLLDKNQEMEFVAIAKMGKGIEHAKFTPGLFYYKYTDDIETGEKNDEAFKKLIEESKKDENKELTIFIESWGQMKARDIFIKAISSLNKNIKDFAKSIK